MKPDATRERMLLYHLPADSEKGRLVRQAAGTLKIHAEDLREDQLNQTVGHLAGLHGFEPDSRSAPVEPVQEELMLLSGLSDEKINQLLGLLRKSGAAPIGLMAVVTEHNRSWRLSDLMAELMHERRIMAAWFSLKRSVKAAESLQDAGHFASAEPFKADAFEAALAVGRTILNAQEPPELESIQAADTALKAFLQQRG